MTTTADWLKLKNDPVKYAAVKQQIMEHEKRVRRTRIEETQLIRRQEFFAALHGRWDELKGTLDLKEYQIISWCFGLDEHETLSLQKIGDRIGICKQAVQQKRDRIIKKLISLSITTPLLR
jgi:DNA-directed RNA polymerase sigma subunit (sigma70/sigma32)